MICYPCVVAGSRLITNMSMEVREANTLHVSEDCPSRMESCLSLNDFLQHPFSFLLLFELGKQNSYKEKIIRAFHEVCRSLKFSKVTCGVVDIYQDRSMAEKMVADLRTVPAHLLFEGTRHIDLPEHHLAKLMGNPGNVEVMKWHVRELVGPLDAMDASTSKKKATKKKKKHLTSKKNGKASKQKSKDGDDL